MDPKSPRIVPQPDPRQLAEHMQAYSETTRGITVTVRPVFLENRSVPLEHQYFWAYFVRIENHGQEPVRLMRRPLRTRSVAGMTRHRSPR